MDTRDLEHARIVGPAGPIRGEAAARWLRIVEGLGTSGSGIPIDVDGAPAIAKVGALRRGSRFLIRRALTGQASPAEAELAHLVWLRERLFRCPRPLVAVTLVRRGVPVAQAFVSARIEAAVPLDRAWPDAGEGARGRWASELGREVGRMHALRFLHADLYGRNVLSAPRATEGPGVGRELVLVDAWAGGPDAWRAGRVSSLERDLGCLFAEAAGWMGEAHQALVLESYARSRSANGRPVDAGGRWLARAIAARGAELRRLRRAPARLRGRAMPDDAWPVAERMRSDPPLLRALARTPRREERPPE